MEKEDKNLYVPELALQRLAKEVIIRALKDLSLQDVDDVGFGARMALVDDATGFFQNAEKSEGNDIWFKLCGVSHKNVSWKAVQVSLDNDGGTYQNPIAYHCRVCGKKVYKWVARGSVFEDEQMCYLCWLHSQKVGRNPLNKAQADAVIAKWKSIGKKCYYCGQPISYREITVDHIIPVSKGGTNVVENLVPCCRSCNSSKNDKDIRYWLPQRVMKVANASTFEAIKAKKMADRLYKAGDRLY